MSKLIPKCRSRLPECDLRFIDRVLSLDASESSALEQLLSDADERDQILDHPALFKAVLEDNELVEISSHFYFYILVRKVLKDAEVDDCEVADYVAGVLSEHMRAPRRSARGFDRNSAYFYVSDAFAHIDRASKSERFFIRVRVANMSLVVTGLFEDHLLHRVERRAALSPAVYADIGRAQFDRVSQHALAKTFDLDGVFAVLARQFDSIQSGIKDLKERLIFLGDPMGKAATYSLFNN
ncbi:MAG: hypothetical protein ACPGN3_04625 [Opitutales bacterium]